MEFFREIRGKKYKVKVDEDGHFYVNFEDTVIKAETMKELESKLFKATRKKWNIEFFRWVEATEQNRWNGRSYNLESVPSHLRRGLVIGKHATNNNVMVKWDGEKGTEQDYGFHDARYLLKLSKDEQERYTTLKLQYESLEAEIKQFEEAHEIDLKKFEEEQLAKDIRPKEAPENEDD